MKIYLILNFQSTIFIYTSIWWAFKKFLIKSIKYLSIQIYDIVK